MMLIVFFPRETQDRRPGRGGGDHGRDEDDTQPQAEERGHIRGVCVYNQWRVWGAGVRDGGDRDIQDR